MPVRSVVVDFDGTICPQDVSEEILEAFAPRDWWEIDLQFQRGEIGSRECLVRQADLLRGREPDMLAFVLDRFTVDSTFPPFVSWAREEPLELAVASDGLGFYIEPMLQAAGVRGVPVLTNAFSLRDGRLDLAFPHSHPFCEGCGTCKMRIVRAHRHRTGTVAFVGEGHSDRYGALYADLVFANKHLAAICRQAGVPFVEWRTFDDVRAGLEAAGDLPGPANPAVCPGWTIPVRSTVSLPPKKPFRSPAAS
ncbi:MAG: MtnX-like HAD-IB family phosphatase [Actinomycetota bacterium]|nr:MtnX-like HAD-IB family phosphatase [Actinomycetota bacterium]